MRTREPARGNLPLGGKGTSLAHICVGMAEVTHLFHQRLDRKFYLII